MAWTFLIYLEQVAGIEPATKAWEALILPLNYTCMCYFVIALYLGLVNDYLCFLCLFLLVCLVAEQFVLIPTKLKP